jgi:hypothetical protein
MARKRGCRQCHRSPHQPWRWCPTRPSNRWRRRWLRRSLPRPLPLRCACAPLPDRQLTRARSRRRRLRVHRCTIGNRAPETDVDRRGKGGGLVHPVLAPQTAFAPTVKRDGASLALRLVRCSHCPRDDSWSRSTSSTGCPCARTSLVASAGDGTQRLGWRRRVFTRAVPSVPKPYTPP